MKIIDFNGEKLKVMEEIIDEKYGRVWVTYIGYIKTYVVEGRIVEEQTIIDELDNKYGRPVSQREYIYNDIMGQDGYRLMPHEITDLEEIERFIEDALISKLKTNNIFEKYMSVEEIKDKLMKLVKCIAYEDIKEHGYWRDGKIGLSTKDSLKTWVTGKSRAVKIHELLHALSTREEKDRLRVGTFIITEHAQYGRGFTEGITEWLVQKICKIDEKVYKKRGISFFVKGSYPMEEAMINQIAILYGEDKVIDAYLNNHNIYMTHEQYEILCNFFDHINDKNSLKEEIQQKRKYAKLSAEEKDKVDAINATIDSLFTDAQQYFLEKCLEEEIKKMRTPEEAEELKLKLKQLNALQIKIEGNEKANYEKYNYMFIRRYLQIANRDRFQKEPEKFDDVEKYLLGDERELERLSQDGEYAQEWLEKHERKEKFKYITAFFDKIFKSLRTNYKFLMNPGYIPVDRGEEGVIYIKECGEETIAGRRVVQYEYLTEESYREYMNGNNYVKSELLRGKIDLKKLQKDAEYREKVGGKLLAEDRIKAALDTCNGYIGHIDENGRVWMSRGVEKRLKGDCMRDLIEYQISQLPDEPQEPLYKDMPGEEGKEARKTLREYEREVRHNSPEARKVEKTEERENRANYRAQKAAAHARMERKRAELAKSEQEMVKTARRNARTFGWDR